MDITRSPRPGHLNVLGEVSGVALSLTAKRTRLVEFSRPPKIGEFCLRCSPFSRLVFLHLQMALFPILQSQEQKGNEKLCVVVSIATGWSHSTQDQT